MTPPLSLVVYAYVRQSGRRPLAAKIFPWRFAPFLAIARKRASKFPPPDVARRFAGPSPAARALPVLFPPFSDAIAKGDGFFAEQWRETMFDMARFHIIGRVGNIKRFDKSVRVSIAANASYKDKGEWVNQTDWNEVVIFNKATMKHVSENVGAGDYVRVEGRLRQNSFERAGETVYTVELICDEFSRMPKKRAEDSAA